MRSKAEEIEQYLLNIIERSHSGVVELKRAELSGQFSCVPSQINYVLNTRFTMTRGFVVESRRGGGGYLRIVKLPLDHDDDMYELLAHMEKETLTQQEAQGLISRLVEEKFFTPAEGRLILRAVSNSVLSVPLEIRVQLRMNIVRAMILSKVREES